MNYRERFSTSLNPELIDRLKQLSEKTRIPMSRLVDEAIWDLCKKYKKNEGVEFEKKEDK